MTAERDDWARSAADNLIGRGSEQRQVNGTASPYADHNHIGVPIGGHSKDFLMRLAENDGFVNATTGRLVLVCKFVQGIFGTVTLVSSKCRHELGRIRRKRVAP